MLLRRVGVGGLLSAFLFPILKAALDSDEDCRLSKNGATQICSWRAAVVRRAQLSAQALLCLSLIAASYRHAMEGLQRGTVALWGLAVSVFCNLELLFFCPVFFPIRFALILDLAALFLIACLHLVLSSLSFQDVGTARENPIAGRTKGTTRNEPSAPAAAGASGRHHEPLSGPAYTCPAPPPSKSRGLSRL